MEYNETPPHALIQYLKLHLKEFVLHNYIARWQDVHFKEAMSNVYNDMVISCIDFSNNYAMIHWHNFQMILVHIIYCLNLEYNPTKPSSKVLKKVHYYVYDDNSHDNLFVQHAFGLHWDFLQARGCSPSLHMVQSDGCSSQVKSTKAWYFVSQYPNLTITPHLLGGCQMEWNFFAIGHGKREVDGVGALLKCEIRKEQIKHARQKIQNDVEVVAYIKVESNNYHVFSKVRHHINEYFHEVKVGDVDRSKPFECEIVHGSQSVHQVRSIFNKNPTLCQRCQLSCLCVGCIDHNHDYPCVHHEHVAKWTLTRLKLRNTAEVREMMYNDNEEIEVGSRGEWIVDNLCPSDNIAIPIDVDEPFWLMLLDKGPYIVQESFIDDDENALIVGDVIV